MDWLYRQQEEQRVATGKRPSFARLVDYLISSKLDKTLDRVGGISIASGKSPMHNGEVPDDVEIQQQLEALRYILRRGDARTIAAMDHILERIGLLVRLHEERTLGTHDPIPTESTSSTAIPDPSVDRAREIAARHLGSSGHPASTGGERASDEEENDKGGRPRKSG